MINNLGGMSVLEMNIIAKETLEYLGEFQIIFTTVSALDISRLRN